MVVDNDSRHFLAVSVQSLHFPCTNTSTCRGLYPFGNFSTGVTTSSKQKV